MTTLIRVGIVSVLLGFMVLGGCRTAPVPTEASPFILDMKPMPAKTGEGAGFSGNVYAIFVGTPTNASTLAQVTNQLPKRIHIDLSLDGGQTWPRRLAYGVPTETNRRLVHYDYSLPWYDESILTENARLRATDLSGLEIVRSDNDFTIAGIFLHQPQANTHVTNQLSVVWFQSGAGAEVKILLLRPNSTMSVLQYHAGAHFGLNSVELSVSGLPTGLGRVVVQSVSDPALYGMSQPIYVEAP